MDLSSMTKEQLQARLNTLINEKAYVAASYEGAIQDCNYWLQQLDVPVVSEDTPVV